MIFPATPQDIATIIAIAEKSWATTYREILPAEQYDYMMNLFYTVRALQQTMKEQTFLLCRHDDRVTGFIAYQLDYPEAGSCKIHKLYVLPETQGSGTGRKLISAVENIAAGHPCSRLTLNVNKYNKALGFYQKMGFHVSRPEVIDIGRGFVMDDFVMEREIQSR
ncbi:MAG: GNAT family N-acetyltransferase [Leadbetterella sp.]|nr:GNAT family N-acetyltransferase [Leadbetterella sp.]